jgi:anti-sigma regulatory factor (Ser/Thr protein kinase)/predicted nucleic acid-binding protein
MAMGQRAEEHIAPGPEGVRQARVFVQHVLDGLDEEQAETVLLLTSEVVTNAFLHARTQVDLSVEASDGVVRVGVRDASSALPRVKNYRSSSTTGRGLHLLESLASSWGVEPSESGKTVWFEVSERGRDARAEEPDFHLDLAAWPDLEDSIPTQRVVDVKLLNVPIALAQRSEEHHDELAREFAILVSGGERGTPEEFLDTLARFEERYGGVLEAAARERDEARARGESSADLHYHLPPEAGSLTERLARLLDRADEYCRNGDLLTLEASEEVKELRQWYYGEMTRQSRGDSPHPWQPGDLPVQGTGA